jgi:hypothetical protein
LRAKAAFSAIELLLLKSLRCFLPQFFLHVSSSTFEHPSRRSQFGVPVFIPTTIPTPPLPLLPRFEECSAVFAVFKKCFGHSFAVMYFWAQPKRAFFKSHHKTLKKSSRIYYVIRYLDRDPA